MPFLVKLLEAQFCLKVSMERLMIVWIGFNNPKWVPRRSWAMMLGVEALQRCWKRIWRTRFRRSWNFSCNWKNSKWLAPKISALSKVFCRPAQTVSCKIWDPNFTLFFSWSYFTFFYYNLREAWWRYKKWLGASMLWAEALLPPVRSYPSFQVVTAIKHKSKPAKNRYRMFTSWTIPLVYNTSTQDSLLGLAGCLLFFLHHAHSIEPRHC